MVQRTESEIAASVQKAIQDASPQVRVDVDKGPFYYLATKGVAGPLADAEARVERLAQLSTNQFPVAATDAEAMAVARSFGVGVGSGGFAEGIAYAVTGRRPVGTQSFPVTEGAVFSTSTNRGVVFEAVESRSLTAANADTFFNPVSRRYELPVRVKALSAGVGGNIPARTLNVVLGGAPDFDGVTNLVTFTGGTSAQSARVAYERAQQKLAGLDNFSRGGLISRAQNLDVDRIQAVSLTYSSEYPHLFYRLPDKIALDAWVLNTPLDTLKTETFKASAGQTQFVLSQGPVLYLTAVLVNGTPVTASLVLDTSQAWGRSTKESSYVSLAVPASQDDLVDVIYGYDAVLASLQAEVDGHLNAAAGSLFATDVLFRYPKTTYAACTVIGKAMGTYDPTSIESEVSAVVGDYLAKGLSDEPLLGGVRSPGQLRDLIKASVPGISTFTIPIFGRKALGQIVETLDIPRNSQVQFQSSADLIVKFT